MNPNNPPQISPATAAIPARPVSIVAAASRLTDAGVDKPYRGRDKASDHAPTWVMLTN